MLGTNKLGMGHESGWQVAAQSKPGYNRAKGGLCLAQPARCGHDKDAISLSPAGLESNRAKLARSLNK